MFPKFEVLGEIIYMYPLILGCIFALSYNLSQSYIKKYRIELPRFGYYFIITSIAMWLGAKLLFLITLDNSLALRVSINSSFWLGGGLVFYGGAIAGLIVTVIYIGYFKINYNDMAFLIPILTLGHAIGRVACFMAGCCYGTECDLPWGINLHNAIRHPVQIYEALALFILSIILYRRLMKGGEVFISYLFCYAIIRFVIEFFRGDQIRGLYFLGISTSQIISIFIVIMAIIFTTKAALSKRA